MFVINVGNVIVLIWGILIMERDGYIRNDIDI